MEKVYITATVKLANKGSITQQLLVEVDGDMTEEDVEAEKERVTEEWAHEQLEFFYEE